MRINVFRMGLRNWVALANLALFGLALVVYLVSDPTCVDECKLPWPPHVTLARAAEVLGAVISFPVGWLSAIGGSVSHPFESRVALAVVFVPLNAYLWGFLTEAIIRRVQKRGAVG